MGVVDNDETCRVELFLLAGPANEESYRLGLFDMLNHVAERGLQDVPSAWWHEADKQKGIYEFIKGPLRLFFFKGEGKQIAVCTSGGRKAGRKADPQAVALAARMREAYFQAARAGTLNVELDDDQDQQGSQATG